MKKRKCLCGRPLPDQETQLCDKCWEERNIGTYAEHLEAIKSE